MATTQIERQTVEQHRLDAVTVAVVLRQAVQQCAPVQLAASNVEGSGLWRGSFIRLATEGIELAPVEPHAAIPQAWHGAPLRATFAVDSKPYSFVSSLADSNEQAVGVILLKRPDSLMHYERRGAPRRRLQQGVPVQIFAMQHSTNQPGAEPIDARLLNLSESGMACLIEVAATLHMRDGALVLLEFELPGAEKSFSLNAVIITTTHGVGLHRVIGLEFVPDKALREQSVPLRQCLQIISTERRQNEPSSVPKESIAP